MSSAKYKKVEKNVIEYKPPKVFGLMIRTTAQILKVWPVPWRFDKIDYAELKNWINK